MSAEKHRYDRVQRVIWITIIINVVLSIIKIGIGIFGNSKAVLADGIHTVSDIGSSLGLIVGVFIASKPSDREHQYGHEKAETIAGFMLSMFLIVVGANIGISGVKNIISGDIEIPSIYAIWASVISILLKELQFRISISEGKKLNSQALIADAWHHRSDSFSSIGVLLGVLGARMGYPILDPIAAIIVSLIVVKAGGEIFLKGYNELMDESISDSELLPVIDKVLEIEEVKIINDIKARKHGSKIFLDVQIAVDPEMTVYNGHLIAERVEKVIEDNLKHVKAVMVHVNPCTSKNMNACELCKGTNDHCDGNISDIIKNKN